MCWGARTEERHPVAPVLAPHIRVSEAIKQPSIATCMYPEFESSIFEGLFCIIKRIGLGVLRNTSLTSNHAAIFLTERLLRRSQAASCKVCTFNTSRPALMFVRDWQPLGTLFVLIPNMFLSFFINSCELWVVLPGKRAQQFYFIQFPWAAWYEYQQIICHAKKIKKVNRIDKKPFQVSLYHIHPYSTKEVIYIYIDDKALHVLDMTFVCWGHFWRRFLQSLSYRHSYNQEQESTHIPNSRRQAQVAELFQSIFLGSSCSKPWLWLPRTILNMRWRKIIYIHR